MPNEPDAVFFTSPADLRRWMEKNHGKVTVLWIAFWKAKSGKTGLTYEEAVEESLRRRTYGRNLDICATSREKSRGC